MSLIDDVRHLYDLPAHETYPALGPILPFVGEAFAAPDATSLRVVAVGLNAYTRPERPLPPERFADWMRDASQRFHRGVAAEVSVLATALAASPGFAGLRYRGEEDGRASLYATNAVKRYLPTREGKRSTRVPSTYLEEGTRVWGGELQAMADHDALPHLIVVFGSRWWRPAWRSLGGPARPSWVRDSRSTPKPSPLHSRLNRLVLTERGEERPVLVVRLRHPAAYSPRWGAEEVAGHADFLAVVG